MMVDKFLPQRAQRDGAATKGVSMPKAKRPLKSPLPPFVKGGLGGISEASFQIKFLFTKYEDFAC
jgi:hypothetical protein